MRTTFAPSPERCLTLTLAMKSALVWSVRESEKVSPSMIWRDFRTGTTITFKKS